MVYFEYICVLDFEATCDDVTKIPHEVIEFPSVLLKWDQLAGNYVVKSQFQQFCKPKLNPNLTKFCIELTGIQQSQTDAGLTFPEVYEAHHKWLKEQIDNSSCIILSCGHWDLKVMMPAEVKRWSARNLRIDPIYKKYINIKDIYQTFYKLPNKLGLAGLYNRFGLQMEGRHHSGLDDCKNIATLVQKAVTDGYKFTVKDVSSV